jgi:hypothetical protein
MATTMPATIMATIMAMCMTSIAAMAMRTASLITIIDDG